MNGTGDGGTLGAVVREAAAALTRAGIGSARRDARILAAHALGLDPREAVFHPERAVPESGRRAVDALIARRAGREPVSRIVGERGFWTLTLSLTPDTLDPRPDSETVIEAALSSMADRSRPLDLLDLGVGSGCLLLALLSELPQATGVGVDISLGAAAGAARNAAAAGFASRVRFVVGDWGGCLMDGTFDLIVSNPPYVPDGDIDGLEPEVARFEPRRALAGGADGLDAYRVLAPQVAALLRPGGAAVFEMGFGQAGAVRALLEGAGLEVLDIVSDLAGIDRVIRVRRGR